MKRSKYSEEQVAYALPTGRKHYRPCVPVRGRRYRASAASGRSGPGSEPARLLGYKGIRAGAGVQTTAATAAGTLGLKTQLSEVREVADFEGALRAAREGRAQAIHVLPSPFFNAHRRFLINLAARYRLPAMYEFREYVQDGGLMSYGASIPDMYRRAATYVDRILKGAKPGDLPIERPTKFELVINLKTAKALGLTIPPSLLQRADEIIR